MRLINMGRGTGKTTKLIHTAEVTGYPILCRTNNMKRSIRDTANKMGALVDIYTYEEFKNIPHNENDCVLLDECYDAISNALDKYFGCKVMAGTLTCPIETPKMETKEELHMSDFEFSRYLIKSMLNGTRVFDREAYDAAQNYIMDHLDDLEEKKPIIQVKNGEYIKAHDDSIDAFATAMRHYTGKW